RRRAEDHDVRLHRFERFGRVAPHLHAETAAQSDDVSDVAACFRRIDVDAADDLEARTRRHLPGNRGADGPEAEMKDADRHRTRIILPRMFKHLCAFTVVSVAVASAVAATAQSSSLAITGATLIDGSGGTPIADAVVVINGTKITAAGPRDRVNLPAGAQTIDGRGKFVMPGMIDTNVH